jgi:hypothetical protein
MKYTISILLMAFTFSAQAKPILYTLNDGGGRIVLTDEKCKKHTGKLAYATLPKAETQLGCWTSDDLNIHIQWQNSELRSYDYDGWNVVGDTSKSSL